MPTSGPISDMPRDIDADADPHSPTNAVAVVCLHAVLSGLLLVIALQTSLPLAAAAGLAWLGGACATVVLLLAGDAAARHDARTAPATAPDL